MSYAIALDLTAIVGLAAGFLARSVFIAQRTAKIDRVEPVDYSIATGKILADLADDIARNRQAIAGLVVAVSDGIAHVKRHETRVAKQVTAARRLLRDSGLEHPGLEAEHEEIRERDGDSGEPETMPAVSEVLEEDLRDSGIPGLTNADVENLKAIGAM